ADHDHGSVCDWLVGADAFPASGAATSANSAAGTDGGIRRMAGEFPADRRNDRNSHRLWPHAAGNERRGIAGPGLSRNRSAEGEESAQGGGGDCYLLTSADG